MHLLSPQETGERDIREAEGRSRFHRKSQNGKILIGTIGIVKTRENSMCEKYRTFPRGAF
jgi:hypothetical protein